MRRNHGPSLSSKGNQEFSENLENQFL